MKRNVWAVVVDDFRVQGLFEDEADADANSAGKFGACVVEMDLYPSGRGVVLQTPAPWRPVWSVRLSPGQTRTVVDTRQVRVEYARPGVVFVLCAPDDTPPVERLLLDVADSAWQPVVLGGVEWEVSVQCLTSYPEIDVHIRARR